MARGGGRGPGTDDGTVVSQMGPDGRQSSDITTGPNKNATSKTGRPDGAGRIDRTPEDPQRFTSGSEYENASEKAKARGKDVIATGQNSEARAGFGRTDSVNHIVGEDVPPLTPVADLIEQGGGV